MTVCCIEAKIIFIGLPPPVPRVPPWYQKWGTRHCPPHPPVAPPMASSNLFNTQYSCILICKIYCILLFVYASGRWVPTEKNYM